MKYLIVTCFAILSLQLHAQYQIKNVTNAEIDELQTIEQVVNWIQFGQSDQVITNIFNDEVIDKIYLNIESKSISMKYPRTEISKQSLKEIKDESSIVWYERTIFKERKKGLKPVYQIYVTIDMDTSPYEILDLFLRRGKKVEIRDHEQDSF
ncbi:hypothetical protein FNB79_01475 [Formosa sediminum]|uniref:DUF4252 domain-containing protein n=1 Tax=Formosa sediminum TaxID=2594004 RepID=A0A516GMF0_9FLAO|nr:hypothetical protein [Formosa sediminum]QDO92704.1 hypothetical protein FNB79_01475 [Formosa sediminum]